MNRTRLAAFTALLSLALLLGLSPAARAEHINTLVVNSIDYGYNASIKLYGNSRTVSIGEFDVTLNNFNDVVAYCVDLNQSFSPGVSYTTYDMYPIDQSLSTLQAGWLLGHYSPGLGYANAGYSTAASITALQLAIWEVTYDYASTYDTSGYYTALNTGNFIVSNLANESSAIKTLALSYLASIPTQLAQLNLTGLDYSGVARSNYQQDFVVGNVNAVPEPGSMLLFGSAAGLLGWLRRRRGQASQAPAREAETA
ncbi:MAG: Cys-Gln thioester bond-forming surface protein [Pseudomonadota bacterium]